MDTFNTILVFSYAVMGFLFVGSVVGGRLGWSVRGVSVIPLLAALALAVYLAVSFGARPLALMRWALAGPPALYYAVGGIVAAAAVTHFVYTWCVSAPAELVGRFSSSDARVLVRSGAVAIWSVLLVSVLVVTLRAQIRANQPTVVASSVEGLIQAVHPLPGGPTDLVFTSDNGGYISLDLDFFTPRERSVIHRFELSQGGEGARGSLRLEPLASGSFIRGLAVLDGTLYASDQGQLPCDGVALINCIPGLDPERGEPAVLPITRGRILGFPILDDGSLGEPQVVLPDLPVVNSEHTVQDIEVGPDGRLYVSIAGPGQIARRPDLIEAMERPNLDLLGTVVSFESDGSDVQVYARGLRNVFQLAFDERGNLFGSENDGPGGRDWKLEEVLHIKQGAHYGFPYEGTFGSREIRTEPPLWVENTVGSAGLEWAGAVGLAPGLLLGSEKRVALLNLASDEAGFYVRSKNDLTTLLSFSSGNVTVLEAAPQSGQLLAGVYDRQSRLVVLDFERAAAGAMLALTCAACHGNEFQGLPGLGPNLTRAGTLASWTLDDFVTALTTGERPDGTLLDGQRMPWQQFAELPEEDLETLWNYLMVRGADAPR